MPHCRLHVEKCFTIHEKYMICPSCFFLDRFSVGQNLAMGVSSSKMPKSKYLQSFVDSWYNEVAVFEKHVLTSFEPSTSSKKWGHFTQV